MEPGQPRSLILKKKNPLGAALALFALVLLPHPAAADLSALNIYPNPVRRYQGQAELVFAGLTNQINVKIFDMDNVLIREMDLSPSGGQARWDLLDDAGHKAASGVYVLVITDNAGERKIEKIAIIR
jgi:hypothetical protein